MPPFLYPSTVSITRPAAQSSSVGAIAYGGQGVPASETAVATNIPASIQHHKPTGAPRTDLPSDASNRTMWRLFTPRAALAKGVLQVRDVVTDDLGVRYQVAAPYWNSLGYAALLERLDS